MYLALKHKAPDGLFPKVFYYLTKARLVTKYPHSGIVIKDKLYHTNLTNGLHCEDFNPEGWDLFKIDEPSELTSELFLELFNQYKGSKYDWFSLLAFVLPWNIRDKSRFYCYEWCWYGITGINPSKRVTPEDLLTLVSQNKKVKNEQQSE